MTQAAARQRIVPMLQYADARAAIAFLVAAFGFEERFRMDMADGTIGHAELALGESVVMLASVWTAAGGASPLDLPGWTSQLHCEVEDVDAHYARARGAGATVIGSPVDQPYGARSYRALDPEGHRWIFSMPIAAGAAQES
jgi:uncharacterized glyoxalase superfamily protein PhnB